MFGDMMDKLQQMKQMMDEAKQRLDTITLTAEAENGAVKIIISGNRQVKDIKISEDVMHDKEALEELLVVAMNRAIEQADKVNEAEMGSSAKTFLPGGFPGF